MKHIGLFEGIGGFSLAARWAGWETIAWCEWNEFGQRVLRHHFPEAIGHGDITKTDFTPYADTIDILTGGFPCQPYSLAGKRKGKDDERHLWPEMLRAIREIRPRWVVGENVFGLVNWSGGLVFHEVQVDLEAAGYEVFPYVLPAVSVNAPHRRDRIWFVAYAKCNAAGLRSEGGLAMDGQLLERCKREKKANRFNNFCENGTTPHPNPTRCENWDKQHRGKQTQDGEGQRCTCGYCIGIDQSTTPNPNRNPTGTSGEGTSIEGIGGSNDVQQSERGSKTELNNRPSSVPRDVTNRESQSSKQNVADTNGIGLRGQSNRTGESGFIGENDPRNYWQNFPTVSPLRKRDDGVSNKLLRFVVNEFYDTISYTSEKNRIKNLQEVWEHIQQEEIWEQIRGLYSLESKNVLLQTMQLYSGEYKEQEFSSPFSEKLCEPIMQHLRKHKEFRCSPQGQELEKQRTEQFGNSLSFLPHEVALAARRFETAVAKFESWHRNESIKAAGNAIVPQVAYQIFKAINQMEYK
jgi:DNA (cytosine-5)-methyltransferase 1